MNSDARPIVIDTSHKSITLTSPYPDGAASLPSGQGPKSTYIGCRIAVSARRRQETSASTWNRYLRQAGGGGFPKLVRVVGSCRLLLLLVVGVQLDQIGQQEANGVGGLLGDDTVTENAKFRRAGHVQIGDPPGIWPGQAHEPFDESRGQPGAAVAIGFGRVWGGYAADGFPASDGRRVLAPLDRAVQAGGAWFQSVNSAGRMPRVISIACSSPGPDRCAVRAAHERR